MARIEVTSEVTGKVWRVLVEPGAVVTPDEPIMVVESMKMEIPVMSSQAGRLVELRAREGDAVDDGQVVAIVE